MRVAVTPPATTVETVRQSVFFVEKADKPPLLEHLLRDPSITRVLVFTRTKHGANRVATKLQSAGIDAEAIHGNKSQGARERALASFKTGAIRVLVATDIAARGIDVEEISHVINFDLPNVPESYVHRIGRTARAGASGDAISFCDREERAFLKDIEREIRMQVPVAAAAADFRVGFVHGPADDRRERRAPQGRGGRRPQPGGASRQRERGDAAAPASPREAHRGGRPAVPAAHKPESRRHGQAFPSPQQRRRDGGGGRRGGRKFR